MAATKQDVGTDSARDDRYLASTPLPGAGGARGALKQISDGLNSRDLAALKFLCAGGRVISAGRLEKVATALDLFAELENAGRFGSVGVARGGANFQLLAEMLLAIRRLDLLGALGVSAKEVRALPAMTPNAEAGLYRVEPFRLMLYQICEDLSKEDVETMVYLIDDLPRSTKSKIIGAEDLVLYLEQQQEITAQDLGHLVTLLVQADRSDLVARINAFRDGAALRSTGAAGGGTGDPSKTPSSPPDASSQSTGGAAMTAGRTAAYQHAPPDDLPNNYVVSERMLAHDRLQGQGRDPNHIATTTGGNDALPNNYVSNRQAMPPGQQYEAEQHGGNVATGHGEGLVVVEQRANRSIYELDESMNGGGGLTKPPAVYPMTRRNRGLCVIINNEKFSYDPVTYPNAKKLANREGSSLDAKKLDEIFDRLCFKVTTCNNLDGDTMRSILSEVAHKDHSAFDCFVCCILSHGARDSIYDCNGILLTINELMSYFTKAKGCAMLENKPKVFILQACQGKAKEEVPEKDDANSVIPNEFDFLLGYSTVPGYVSYRSKSKGSFYIESLTKMLREHGTRVDLLSILTMVNEDVPLQKAKFKDKSYYQCPAPMHTLRRQILFSEPTEP